MLNMSIIIVRRFAIIIFTEKNIYRLRSNWTFENKAIPQEQGIVITDLFAEIQEDVLKISLIADNHMALEECRRLDIWQDWKLEYSGKRFLEIVNKNAGKDYAMAHLLKTNTVSGEIVFAAGNSMNDIDMLKASDYSFAPIDSDKNVLKVCDYIIDTAANGGIKKAIEVARCQCKI